MADAWATARAIRERADRPLASQLGRLRHWNRPAPTSASAGQRSAASIQTNPHPELPCTMNLSQVTSSRRTDRAAAPSSTATPAWAVHPGEQGPEPGLSLRRGRRPAPSTCSASRRQRPGPTCSAPSMRFKEEHGFKTLVIDTIDWLEPLLLGARLQDRRQNRISGHLRLRRQATSPPSMPGACSWPPGDVASEARDARDPAGPRRFARDPRILSWTPGSAGRRKLHQAAADLICSGATRCSPPPGLRQKDGPKTRGVSAGERVLHTSGRRADREEPPRLPQ